MNESVNPTSLLTAIIAVLQNKRVDLPLICMIYKVYSFFENSKWIDYREKGACKLSQHCEVSMVRMNIFSKCFAGSLLSNVYIIHTYEMEN